MSFIRSKYYVATLFTAMLVGCSPTDATLPPPARTVSSVRLTPAAFVLEVGERRQMSAVPVDSAGSPITGRVIEWSAHPASVATISATGEVLAIGNGYATVSATIGGIIASVAVTVVLPEGEYDRISRASRGAATGSMSSRPKGAPRG